MEEKTEIKESPHSVKFSINAKGLYSGECKVYAQTPTEALRKASHIADSIEQVIRTKNGA